MSSNRQSASLIHSEFGAVPSHVSTPSLGSNSVMNFATAAHSDPVLAQVSTGHASQTAGSPTVSPLTSSISDSATPSAAAAASVANSLMSVKMRTTWLEVQASRDEETQKRLLVDVMFECFVLLCTSSAATAFRQTFGDGASLMNVLCRLLCFDTRQALRGGCPQCIPTTRLLLDSHAHMIVLSYFSTLCDPSFYGSAVEQVTFEGTIRILALHNIPSILASLHKGFLDLVESSKQDVAAGVSPHMAAADQKYLALLQTMLAAPHESAALRLAHDLQQVNGIVYVTETLPTALRIPFWASASIAELAAAVVSFVIHTSAQRSILMTPRVVEEIERLIMDGVLNEADSAHEEFGDTTSLHSMKLATLTQILTVILALRREFRTAANFAFDFGLVTTVLLSLQDVMGQQRRTTKRLLQVLIECATLPPAKANASKATSDKKKGFSLSSLTSQISKMVGAAVSGLMDETSVACSTITAPQILEGLSLFIICATNEDARLQVSQELFGVLQQPTGVEPAFFLSQLSAIAEAIPSMSLLLMTEFLQCVDGAAHRLDASNVLVILSRKLIDVDHVSELHIIKLIAFFTSLGSRSTTACRAVLSCGVIRNTTRLIEMIGVLPNSDEVLRNIVRLWGTLVRVSGSVEQFDSCKSASIVLGSLLKCGLRAPLADVATTSSACTRMVAHSADGLNKEDDETSPAEGKKRRTIVVLCREAFVVLVSAKRENIAVLLEQLLHLTGKGAWSNEVSLLLCVLVVTLARQPECIEDAISSNAVELCLSFLQLVDRSDRTWEEVTLLSTCLSLLVPVVRFSEVGRMLSVSLPQGLVGSTVLCQLLADLALGATRAASHITALASWYDRALCEGRVDAFENHYSRLALDPISTEEPTFMVVGDVFFIPRDASYFCEVSFPLLELCRWYHSNLLASSSVKGAVEANTIPEGISSQDLQDCPSSKPITQRTPLTISSNRNDNTQFFKHTTQQLAELVRAVASRLAAPIKDPQFASFVLDLQLLDLIPHIADVCSTPATMQHYFTTSERPTIEELEHTIRTWEATVIPNKSTTNTFLNRDTTHTDFPHYIQFFGKGGAFGFVDLASSTSSSASGDGWPAVEGYSVSMWCWWSESGVSEQLRRATSSFVDVIDVNGEIEPEVAPKYIPLWSCHWATTDPSATPCRVSLRVNLVTQFSEIDILFNGTHHKLEFPLIPQRCWTHVVFCHQRNKVFASEASVFLDAALVKKATLTYPLTVLTQASGFGPCRSFNCVLGFDRGEGAPNHHLKVGPFQVYNACMTQEAVTSVFSSSILNHHTGRWGAEGDVSLSIHAVVLDGTFLNGITAAASNDALEATLQKEALSLVAPPQQALVISLHPARAMLVEASFRYLDNRDWGLTNLAAATNSADSMFVLLGPHSEPTCTYVDPAHALVAHGATSEWLRWIQTLAEWDVDVEKNQSESNREKVEALAAAAIRVIATCVGRVPVKELRHRSFYYNIAQLVLHRPKLFVGYSSATTSNNDAMFTFYTTQLYADGSSVGSKSVSNVDVTNASTTSASSAVELSILSNTAASEMLFCNAEVLSHLPEQVVDNILRSLHRLLDASNRFHRLNALRLKGSGFVNGFIYGLTRAYLSPPNVSASIEAIGLFLDALSDDAQVVCEIMTCLVATTPSQDGGDTSAVCSRLGSSLALAAPDYITLFRNLILRHICETLLDATSGQPQKKTSKLLLNTLGESTPLAWVYVMTGKHAHPVTVALSLQVVVTLMQCQGTFRSRADRGNVYRILMENLHFHCHQPDVASLLLHAFLGHSRNVMVYQASIIDESLAPTELGIPQLMMLLIFLQKCNAISARDPTQIAQATRFYEQIPATAYFSQAGRQLSKYRLQRPRRILRGVCCAIRFCSRLRRHAAFASAPTTLAEETSVNIVDGGTLLDTPAGGAAARKSGRFSVATTIFSPLPQRHDLEDECVRRKDLVVRVLNWIATRYVRYEYVACSMFNPIALCGASAGISGAGTGGLFATSQFSALPSIYGTTYPVDAIAWIMVCALGDMDTITSLATAASPTRMSSYAADPDSIASPEATRSRFSASMGGEAVVSDDDADDNLDLTSGQQSSTRLGGENDDGSPLRGRVTTCLSLGLDELPAAAHDAMFQACCNVYVGLMEKQVRDYVAVHLAKQNIKTSPFALIVHYLLLTCPSGIGDHAEACFHAAVLSLWIQTTTKSLSRYPLNGEQGHFLSKNCVSVAHYTVERLSCGLATPPNRVIQYLSTLLSTLQYADHLKQVRHLVLEWLCAVLSPSFYTDNTATTTTSSASAVQSRAIAVRDLIYQHRAFLFSPQILTSPTCSVECHRYLLIKMLELSCHCLPDYTSTQSPNGQRMAEIWMLVLSSFKMFTALSHVLAEGCGNVRAASSPIAGGAHHYDFMHGGFDILNQRIGAVEMFLSWFADQRYSIVEYLKNHAPVQPIHSFKMAGLGGFSISSKRYLKWVARTNKEIVKSKAKLDVKSSEALRAVQQTWERFRNTGTFIDPNLLKQRDFARGDVLVVRCFAPSAIDEASSMEQQQQQQPSCASNPVFKKYYRPQGGITCWRWYPTEVQSQSRLVELGGEPVGVYLSSPPPRNLITLQSGAAADIPSASGNLKSNAAALVDRFMNGGSPQPRDTRILWIGNIYYIVGTESIICTMMVSKHEVVLVSHSQVTTTGDFFVTQIRKHTAADKHPRGRQKAAAAFQEALGRFLPRQATVLVNAASGGPSLSSHRHSQYYRQLRTEALQKDLAAFVWRFSVSTVQSIHSRRFQHQGAALEFLLESGNVFFVVILDSDLTMSKQSREHLLHVLGPLLPQGCTVETNKHKELRVAQLQRRWLRGGISNMEYILALNDATSRTTSDITQYPVAPWVLQQYDEVHLDISQPCHYRDLSKPMGALSAANAIHVQERYNEWPDDSQPPFHYGTHFSTSAIVMYYLLRLEPFHQWSARYQGGKLDVADRLFHSVAEAWASSSGVGSDVKELIPELFRSSVWVHNTNKIALGVRRDGVPLHHVVLPPWCANRSDIFMNLMAEALEGEVASATIHLWFDLVFGCKQRGEAAVKALNVFHHLSYDDGLDRAMSNAASEEDRKAIVASVDNFGLTPKQLFTTPHPKRVAFSSVVPRQLTFIASLGQIVRKPNPMIVLPPTLHQGYRSGSHGAVSKIVDMQCIDSIIFVSTVTARFSSHKPLTVVHRDESSGTLIVDGRWDANISAAAVGSAASPASSHGSTSTPVGVTLSTLTATAGGSGRVNVLPSCQSFGLGEVTAFCASPCGNIVICGTDHGAVVVFSRSTAASAYSISSIAHPHHATSPSANAGLIRNVKLWPDGHLAVSSEPGILTFWQVSHRHASFCFTLDIVRLVSSSIRSCEKNDKTPLTPPLTAADNATARATMMLNASFSLLTKSAGSAAGVQAPSQQAFVVRGITRSERTTVTLYYAYTDSWILVFTANGVPITQVSIRDANPYVRLSALEKQQGGTRSIGALASAVTSSQTLEEPITSIAFGDFASHSTTNVLICGHANGCVTFWTISTELSNEGALPIRSVHFHSCIVVEKSVPVTSILIPPSPDTTTLVFGLGNGCVVSYAVPMPSDAAGAGGGSSGGTDAA